MYTQCPQCLTYFQVTPEHLKIAQGNVRCGQCRTVFSALGNLTEEPPQIDDEDDDSFDEDIFIDESELEQDIFESSLHGSSNTNTNQTTPPKPSKLGQAIAAIQALNKNSSKSKQKPKPAEPPITPVKSKKSKAAKKPAAPNRQRDEAEHNPQLPSSDTHAEDDINYEEALDALDQLRLTEAMESDHTFINSGPTPNAYDEAESTRRPSDRTDSASQAPYSQSITEQAEQKINLDSTIIHTPATQAPAKPAARRKQSKKPPEPQRKPRQTRAKKRTRSSPRPGLTRDDIKEFRTRPSKRKKQVRVSWWGVGGVCLMVVFLLQTVYFKHDDLAKNASLRPWIESFCKTLSCEVSLPSEVKKLELIGQDIRSHPEVASALKVSTTIINNATYPLAYPLLQITFSDINGQPVAERKFKPKEYLPIQTKFDKGMAPNTPIRIELEMLDPGSHAVNFEFDFFPFFKKG